MATSEINADRSPAIVNNGSFGYLVKLYGWDKFISDDWNYYAANPNPLGYNYLQAPFYGLMTGRIYLPTAATIALANGDGAIWGKSTTAGAHFMQVSKNGIYPAASWDARMEAFSLRNPPSSKYG